MSDHFSMGCQTDGHEHAKPSEIPPMDGMMNREASMYLNQDEAAAVVARAESGERPLFNRPVSWVVSTAAIPDILERMGEALPEVQDTLRLAIGSRYAEVGIYMTPEEAEALWDFFEEERERNAAVVEEGTEVDIRNLPSHSNEEGEVDSASKDSPKRGAK